MKEDGEDRGRENREYVRMRRVKHDREKRESAMMEGKERGQEEWREN